MKSQWSPWYPEIYNGLQSDTFTCSNVDKEYYKIY